VKWASSRGSSSIARSSDGLGWDISVTEYKVMEGPLSMNQQMGAAILGFVATRRPLGISEHNEHKGLQTDKLTRIGTGVCSFIPDKKNSKEECQAHNHQSVSVDRIVQEALYRSIADPAG
jgi:hypothetical protein